MSLLSKIKDAKIRLSGFWAIEKDSYTDIIKLYNNFEANPKSFIQDVNAIDDLFNAKAENILFIKDNEATINIKGALVDEHDCATIFFGATSYADIRVAIEEVEGMDHIDKVVFNIDSPGGMVAGVDNAAIAIKSMKNTTEARIGVMAASAAYWLASQCDSITATSATAMFGSIGVVVEYWDATRSMESQGLDKVCITSTGAPNKRVDALTDEGRRKIKSDLDDIENIFFRRIADGRNTTVSKVAANFGQGGMFLAEKSLNVGMIDKTDFLLNNNTTSNKNNKTESVESKMDLKEFLSKNPDAKKEIDGLVSNAVVEANKINTEEKEGFKKVIDKASAYVTNSNYDDGIKNLAIEVMKGEKSLESLEVVVSLSDKNKEKTSSEAAANETEEQSETPAQENITSDKNGVNGSIKDEDSYQSALVRLKKLK